jgi:hypothetical protein
MKISLWKTWQAYVAPFSSSYEANHLHDRIKYRNAY